MGNVSMTLNANDFGAAGINLATEDLPAMRPFGQLREEAGLAGLQTGNQTVQPLSQEVPVSHTETDSEIKIVAVCDTQPVTAEGVRTLLSGCSDLQMGTAADSLAAAKVLLGQCAPAVLMVDKAFGIQPILNWLAELRTLSQDLTQSTAVVIWGASVSEAEALRFMQAGARGILRKTAGIPVVMACLRTVAAGRSWMEDCVFGDMTRAERYPRSELTSREQQVLELVEQGFKNREIAIELGIRPGTVKIHLKHIFEKTGVRGRYGLALNGLKDKGMVTVST